MQQPGVGQTMLLHAMATAANYYTAHDVQCKCFTRIRIYMCTHTILLSTFYS